jgi:hypothetical protein
MTPYFFVFIVILLADISKNKSTYLHYFIVLLVGIFLCTGYMVGSDWRIYELYYNQLEIDDFNERIEIGYYYLMKLFILLGFGFWEFFILIKFLLYFATVNYIKSNLKEYFYFALLIYFSYLGVFCFIDNPMRFLIASTIFLYAIKFIINNKFFPFIFIIAVASIFHYAFILLTPIYFIGKIFYGVGFMLIFFIFINIILILLPDELVASIRFLSLFISTDYDNLNRIVDGYIISDESIGDKIMSIGVVAKYILFGILLYGYKKINDLSFSKSWLIFLNLSILSIFIMRIALLFPIIFRYSIPFAAIYSISLASIIKCNIFKYKKLIYSLVILISAGSLFKQITTDYRYIPYSSYVFYLFQEKPNYDFRSDFNHNLSPYRFNK